MCSLDFYMAEKIIAFFTTEADAQKALNSLVQSGFDTIDVSIIMRDKRDPNAPIAVPYEEENPMEEGYGTLWTISGEYIDNTQLSIPELGKIIVGGPILETLDTSQYDASDKAGLNLRLEELLERLGIPAEEMAAVKGRIKNNEILIAVDTERENKAEIRSLIFNDGGEVEEY